ncbi:MAG TPA: hypothetical protein VMX17_02955 [Candidatus Glassbacteria bacterium]|nr:hypothetical protein [Candidatus Glassbacteria bacterium]
MTNKIAAYLDHRYYSFMISFTALCFTFNRPFKEIELEWEQHNFKKFLKITYYFNKYEYKVKETQ